MRDFLGQKEKASLTGISRISLSIVTGNKYPLFKGVEYKEI